MSDTDATADSTTDTGRLPAPTGDLDRYLQIGGLVLAAVFVVLSAFGLYSSAQRIIDVWVTEPYQPMFVAGLNLVVLLLALGVATVLVRRLSE